MRKFFVRLVIGAAVLLVLAVVVVGYVAVTAGKESKQAKAFGHESVVAITSNWRAEEMRARSSPELLASTRPEDLDTMFELFAKLGPLIDVGESRITSTLVGAATAGPSALAHYVVDGRYKSGAARIEMNLVRRGSDWKISGFQVNSPALLESAVGRKT